MSPALTTTFRSLRIRNYRLFAGGQVVSLSGTWAQRVAQDWLVLELSGGSGVALGVALGLQFFPILLLGLYGGVLADRYDKRALLLGAQAGMGVLALVLAVLDLSGAVALWHVYVLAALLGVCAAVDTPVRQAFVSELVGPADLPNAISLNSATFNSARIVGPALAGVLIATAGTGWVFLLNALSYMAVLGGLAAMRVVDLQPGRRVARAPGQTREGLAYVRRSPDLLVPIVLIGVMGLFGLNLQVTLPLLVREVFDRGAGSFALATSCLAAGSLLGALASARRDGPPRQRRLFLAAGAFGALEVAAGLAPTYPVMLVLLVPVGFAVLTTTTTANSGLQLRAAPEVRGRVVALYVLVFLGGTPFGAPLMGAVAELFGPRAAVVLGGLVTLVAAVLAAVWLARSRRLRLEPHLLRRRPHPPAPVLTAPSYGGRVEMSDLALDDPRWEQALPVLQELRPHLSAADRRAVQAEGEPLGLRFTGAFDGAACAGVAGWRIVANTHALRKLYVEDLVTASAARSGGVGRALLEELTRRARAAGCTVLDLDSGVQRFDAHRFYLRERMHISSHHFTLPLR